jgi:S-adenosylmethionine synthetase
MSTLPEVPQFGALLRDHIQSVPPEAQPAFLAGLERSAAERYRGWAEQFPDHADELLACAASEDRIADIVSGLFPIDDEQQAQVEAALPTAITVYYDVFAPFSPTEQLYLQSEAEIQGSQAWVRMSEQITDEATLASLRECTELELQSSVAAKAILDALASTAV